MDIIEENGIKYKVLSYDRTADADFVATPRGDIRRAEWNSNDDVLYFKFGGAINPWTVFGLQKEGFLPLKMLPEAPIVLVREVDDSGYINVGKSFAGMFFKVVEIPWGEDEKSIMEKVAI